MAYECRKCNNVELRIHDYCGDYFGYTMDKGFICPECGTQYKKKEHGKFKERNKKDIALCGIKTLMTEERHYPKKIKVDSSVEDKYSIGGNIYKKSNDKCEKHFVYYLDDTVLEQFIQLNSKESFYILKKFEFIDKNEFDKLFLELEDRISKSSYLDDKNFDKFPSVTFNQYSGIRYQNLKNKTITVKPIHLYQVNYYKENK